MKNAATGSQCAVGCASVILLCAGLAQADVAIPIPNYSFETATLPLNGDTRFAVLAGPLNNLIAGSHLSDTAGTLADWTASSTSLNADVGALSPDPGGSNWSSKWWDGNNIAYMQETSPGTTASLSQTISYVLADNTTYTLSALIGRRAFAPANLNYSIQLWAGSTLLTSASNLALARDSFGLDSAVYASGSNDPNAGKDLQIVLSSTDVNGGFIEAFFDDVSLTASTPTPEPSEWSVVVLILIGLLTWRARLRRTSARRSADGRDR